MNNKLSDLKKSWKSLEDNDLKKDISKEDISKLLRKKSKTQLDKIKYTAIIEATIGIPIIILFAIYSPKMFTVNSWLLNTFMFIMLIILIIPTLKLFRIGRFQNQSTIEYLKKFTSISDYILKSYLTIIKVFLSIGVIIPLIINDLSRLDGIKDILIFGVVFIIFCFIVYVPMYFLLKWYYKTLYQKPNDKLKIILEELEENENQENISK